MLSASDTSSQQPIKDARSSTKKQLKKDYIRNWLKARNNTSECSREKLTNKEASTALCSVVKHAGSGRARKKCRGKHETQSSVFPHFLSALPRALLHCM